MAKEYIQTPDCLITCIRSERTIEIGSYQFTRTEAERLQKESGGILRCNTPNQEEVVFSREGDTLKLGYLESMPYTEVTNFLKA